jgi:uncharacterized protein (TIGR03437 family)
MSHRILGASAVCIAIAASQLHAQRLFVEPGANSTSQNVEALAVSPVSPVTGFQAGVGTFLILQKPDGSKYYAIGSSTNQSITVVDPAFAVPRNIAALPQPATTAVLSPDGSRLAVAAGAVHIFDTSSDTDLVAGGLTVGPNISVIDLVFGLDGTTLYTLGVSVTSTQINAIDVATNAIVGTLGFHGVATSISVGPNGLIYVTLTNQVIDINPSTFTENPAGPISLNAAPGRPAFTPDGHYALFPNQTPITGSSFVLVSLASRTVVGTAQAEEIALDTLFVTGTNTILGYSSGTQSAYQINIGSTGSLGISAFTLQGSGNLTTALAISNEVPIGGRTFVSALFAVGNGFVNELNPQSGNLQSQSKLPIGVTSGALSFTRPAVTNTSPVTVLQYGGGQTLANNVTSAPIVVRVLDSNSLPISGAIVSFTTNGPGSTVSPTSAVTTSAGYAVAYLTTGPTDGPLQVAATVGNHTATFNMTVAKSGSTAAGALAFISGQGQIMPAGYNTQTGLAGSHLSVLVTDTTGNPLADAPVTFTISSGTGTLFVTNAGGNSQTVNSDVYGVATVDFLAPEVQGPDATRAFSQTQVTTTSPGTNNLVFTITITPINAPATIAQQAPLPGATISGQVNQTIPGALVYRIISDNGYAIPGVSVRLSTQGLDPTVFPTAKCNDPNGNGVLSDGTGTITCDLVIGPREGSTNVVANVGYSINLSPFRLVALAGPPATVKLIQGNNQTGGPGATLSTALVVQVSDTGGNLLIGAPVTWTVGVAGTATLSQVIAVTDTNGRASAVVTLGLIAGAVQVTATAGSASAIFNLAAIIPSFGIQKVSGDGQSAVTNTAFTSPLVVVVTGSDGTGVAGAPVTFQITAGSAILGSPTGTSGANGQVSTSVQAGSSAGQVTITATTSTFSVTFNLIVRLPGPTNLAIVNGASFQPSTGISPGGIAIVTGVGILPGVQGLIAGNNFVGPLPTSLQGVSVTFNGVAAPIYYVMNSEGVEQVAVQVPFETMSALTASGAPATANVDVVVTSSGGTPATISVPVKPLAPGVFLTTNAGQTYAVAQRPDGSYVSLANPAQLGENITVYVTGLGQVSPAAGTGVAGKPGETVVAPLLIGLNGSGIPLISADYVQGLIGVYMVTFHVPATTATGTAQPLAVVAYDSTGKFYFSQASSIAVAAAP